MKRQTAMVIALTALWSMIAFASAPAADFYSGKTIRFVVGYAPGGGYDTYTRAVARYIGRHIPGNPSVMVENSVPLLTRIAASIFALLIVGVMTYVVYEAKYGFGAFEPRAGIFPLVVGVPCLALALYIFAKEVLTSTQEIKIGGQYAILDEPEIEPIVARQHTFAIGCWIVGFFIAIWIAGFIPASAIATFLYLKFGAGERWPVTLAITAGCWLFFFALFDYALQLPFPRGALFEWLPVNVANSPWNILI